MAAGASLCQKALPVVCLGSVPAAESLIPVMSEPLGAHSVFRDEIYSSLLLIHLDQLMEVDCLVPQRVVFFLDPTGSHELVSASPLNLILSDCLVKVVSRIEDLRGDWAGNRLILLMKVI
jgi:hypothetical protein